MRWWLALAFALIAAVTAVAVGLVFSHRSERAFEARAEEWPGAVAVGLAAPCAVLAAMEPVRLAHFSELRDLPVNPACSPGEAVSRIALYGARIDEGFGLLDDASLGKTVGTVFVARGETILTLFLGNLEHLINHKHQLFTYLKQMGVAISTRDLYRFR